MKRYLGEIHHRWKGDDAKYCAKHTRLYRRYGKPDFCEACGTEESGKYHWANITGDYSIDRENWLRLCFSCHRKLDYTDKQREAVRKNAVLGHLASRKKVEQLNEAKIIQKYVSLSEASRVTGILITSIANMLAGRSKTAGGFRWRYSN